MPLFWMILPYFLGLTLFSTIALREFRTFRAALILFGDWSACTFLADVFGSQTEWIGLAVIDGIAAALFLLCRRRMEASLALTLIMEIIVHLSYGWHELLHITATMADIYHWWITFFVAWGQAFGVVVWGYLNGGKRYPAVSGVRLPSHHGIRAIKVGDSGIMPSLRGRDAG